MSSAALAIRPRPCERSRVALATDDGKGAFAYARAVVQALVRKYGDVVLAVALTATAQAELWLLHLEYERALFVPLALLTPLSLIWRKRYPIGVLLLQNVAWIVIDMYTPTGEDPLTLGITLAIAIFSVGAHTQGRQALVGGLVVAAFGLEAVAVDWDSGTLTDLLGNLVFFTAIFGGAWLAGRAMRGGRRRERELILEREEKARAAVLEERSRIARELHDVVAHAISVIVLQARGGRRSLASSPEDARRALDAIETTASQALAEMRRLLGLLRADDETLGLAPQPGLAALGTLVEQVREAGLPTDVRVDGEPKELPPGVDLSAYRIVQEALTNALKHAGSRAHARVVIRYGADELVLEVADDGTGSEAGNGAGHGLTGMRERVSIFGGRVESGPRPEGGFAVRARLPL